MNGLDTDDDYVFDSSGNTIENPQGWEFTYDAENKQVKVMDGSVVVGEYWYDGDGKRVRKLVFAPEVRRDPSQMRSFWLAARTRPH